MKKRWFVLGGILFLSSALFVSFLAICRSFTNELSSLSGQPSVSDFNRLLSHSEWFVSLCTYLVILLFMFLLLSQALYFLYLSRLEEHLNLSQRKLVSALIQTGGQVWEYDILKDTFRYYDTTAVSPEFRECIRDMKRFLLDREYIHPEDQSGFIKFYESLSDKNKLAGVEFRLKNASGTYQWYEATGEKLFNLKGKPVSVIGHLLNIESKKQEAALRKQKEREDSLTGLPGKNALEEMIDGYLAALDHPAVCALCLIDLDYLSRINESYGQLYGNGILIDAAAKLKKLVLERGILGRSGGDEFLVFYCDLPSLDTVRITAETILGEFHNISGSGTDSPRISASIGIALFPKDGTDFSVLYESASSALNTAKAAGRNCYRTYSAETVESASARLEEDILEELPDYEDRSMIDSTLLTNAINILSDSRELNTTIDLLLSMTGSYFRLDRLNIFEYSEDGSSVSCTHEWASRPEYRISARTQGLPVSRAESYSLFKTRPTGVFYIDEISRHQKEGGYGGNSTETNHTRAVYQCGLAGPDGYIGYVAAATCEKPLSWGKNIVDTLTMISRLIGGYIVNFRLLKKTLIRTEKDTLIDAYNFNTFLDRASERLSAPSKIHYAMVYTDIYQFKLINDNYGYQEGDRILIRLANIMHELGGPDSLLCRVTGDRFVALIPYADSKALEDKIKILLIKSRHIEASNHTFYRITLKIGVYPVSEGDSAIVAVDRANIARKNAQGSHETNYVYFTSQMRASLIERKKIEDVMDGALFRHEFEIYYQPKIDLVTGRLAGAEALVRWNRPGFGIIPPGQFIPLFEENGFIIPLDYYVLENVCLHLREWLDEQKPVVPISVNFSRAHFSKDALANVLLETANSYKIPPSLLEVEITESILAENDTFLLTILHKIQSYGFYVSMDDFGSGLSSLNMLSSMPFNTLKIDKDFFHTNTTTKRERIVISNIVRMASELNMEVICEGVETEEQAEFLRSIHCNLAQGFLFSKPVPYDEFTERFLGEPSKSSSTSSLQF